MEVFLGVHYIQQSLQYYSEFTAMTLLLRESPILIDTGLPTSVNEVLNPYFAKIGFDPRELRYVVNTHFHGDHIGGNPSLRQESSAKFMAHPEAVKMIEIPRLGRAPWERYYRYFPGRSNDDKTAGEAVEAEFHMDVALKDKEIIDLGDSQLQVIYTPGHSPDSICLYEDKTRTLYTGDSIQGEGTHSMHIAMYDDPDIYVSSIKSLLKYPFEIVIADHAYKPYPKGIHHADTAREFLDKSLTCVARYHEQFYDILRKAGAPLSLDRVALEMCRLHGYDDFSIQSLFTTEGHLRKLVREGHAIELDGRFVAE